MWVLPSTRPVFAAQEIGLEASGWRLDDTGAPSESQGDAFSSGHDNTGAAGAAAGDGHDEGCGELYYGEAALRARELALAAMAAPAFIDLAADISRSFSSSGVAWL